MIALSPKPIHPHDISPFSPRADVGLAQSQIDREIDDFESAILVLKRRRNTLSLVSRLPFEILGRVFESTRVVMSDERTQQPQIGWIAVSHVCSHWREIAMNWPQLWSHIDFRCLKWAEEMLHRSKMAPLTVRLDLRLQMSEPARSFWVHLPRIRKLRFTATLPCGTGPGWLRPLQRQLSGFAPCLNSLSLSLHHLEKLLPDDVFSADIPSLRHLELKHCPVSWQWPQFKQLISLQLSFDENVGLQPSASQLISILSDMPNLEFLHLHDVIPQIFESDLSLAPQRRVLLPHLLCLSIISDIRSCSGLLNHLMFPSLTSLELKCTVEEGSDPIHGLSCIFPTLSYWCNPNRPGAPTSITHLKCHAREGLLFDARDDHSLPTEPRASKPRLKLEFIANWDLSKLVLPVCKSLPLQGLEVLRTTFLRLSRDVWLRSFGQLPRLTSIGVTNDADRGFIRALSAEDPYAYADQQKVCLSYFPALRYLKIVGWDFDDIINDKTCFDRLVECLRTRQKLRTSIQALYLSQCRNLLEVEVSHLRTIVPRVNWDNTVVLGTESDSEEDYEDYYDESSGSEDSDDESA